jgi:hypothetical protein
MSSHFICHDSSSIKTSALLACCSAQASIVTNLSTLQSQASTGCAWLMLPSWYWDMAVNKRNADSATLAQLSHFLPLHAFSSSFTKQPVVILFTLNPSLQLPTECRIT